MRHQPDARQVAKSWEPGACRPGPPLSKAASCAKSAPASESAYRPDSFCCTTGGVGRSGGRNVPDALIDCCTSCSATSMFRLSLNCSVITLAAVGTGGGHLLQTRHLPELALQRRGHRRRHHVRDWRRDRTWSPGSSDSLLRAAPKPAVAGKPQCPPAGCPPSSSEVATGRRMNVREGFTCSCLRLNGRPASYRCRRVRRSSALRRESPPAPCCLPVACRRRSSPPRRRRPVRK